MARSLLNLSASAAGRNQTADEPQSLESGQVSKLRSIVPVVGLAALKKGGILR